MSSDFQVAVIGGGIVGCSVLYHLARLGWTDTTLIEKRILTSGSTWHAAGNVTYFGHYPSITQLYVDSVTTYLEAEKESNHSVGFHKSGSLRLATNQKELNAFRALGLLFKEMNIDYRVIDTDEIERIHPMLSTHDLLGAAYTPDDGHFDAYSTTYALARAALYRGAEVITDCEIERLERRSDGNWLLIGNNQSFIARHVVIANSFWARELAESIGLNLPLYALEHHDLVTETLPEIECLEFELPVIRDPVAPANIRQEINGLLCGVYESNPKPWAIDGIPKDFEGQLLPNDMDRLESHLVRVIDRIPAFFSAGVKSVINGPICYTPDGCPLLGPLDGYPGLWLATGFCIGIGTGGGSGAYLSSWIVNDRAPYDLPAVQPNRFRNDLTRDEIVSAIVNTYVMGYTLPEA